MVIKIRMPALSPTMKSGNLVKWNKKVGDNVKSGDALVEIETDKSTMEYESPDDGVLAKILVSDGASDVQVNSIICILAEDGEDYKEVAEKFVDAEEVVSEQNGVSGPIEKRNESVKTDITRDNSNIPANGNDNNRNRVIASPIAKRLVEDNGFDISKIGGSGPNGRVTKSDVLNFKKSSGSTEKSSLTDNIIGVRNQDSIINTSGMRRVIAERLSFSKSNIPHFYLSVLCDVENLLESRKKINEYSENKITINDMIVKAVAQAMILHPGVNREWNDNSLMQYGNIDISIAVDIPDGLITPIVKNADRLRLSEVSSTIKDLVVRARDGKLKSEEYQGGSITISNLGMFNVKSFTAIINPPQASILAIGGVSKQVVINKNDEMEVRSMMEINISADHRVIDGALCAKFLNEIKKMIENPFLFLI